MGGLQPKESILNDVLGPGATSGDIRRDLDQGGAVVDEGLNLGSKGRSAQETVGKHSLVRHTAFLCAGVDESFEAS
ncbi:hypothetical protein ACE0DR_15685 [Azotobacter sp. CWF10]